MQVLSPKKFSHKQMKSRLFERLSNFLLGDKLERWARQKFTVHAEAYR